MPKISDAKEALQKLAEEVKLFRGLRGEHLDTIDPMKGRPNYAVFASSDPHVASTYANPDFSFKKEQGAVFPFRARPKKIIEFPVKKSTWGTGNDFDKFEFDRVASQLKPGEALVARNVYDVGPRSSWDTDPERKFSYPSDVWAIGPEVETTPLHKAKGGKISALDAATQYVKNKLPQTGFFSTLDELIANAPFEKAPLDQWKAYLKPGREFEREGVRFPLKQEELDYSGLFDSFGDDQILPGVAIEKKNLRTVLQGRRPDISMKVKVQKTGDLPGGNIAIDPSARFPEEYKFHDYYAAIPDRLRRVAPHVGFTSYDDYAHAHQRGNYEESATLSGSFGPYPTHFGPEVLSHSRTTIQPTAENGELVDEIEGSPVYQAKLMRLIEEIQSDRHQAAAARIIPRSDPEYLRLEDEVGDEDNPAIFERMRKIQERYPRRGYQDPDHQLQLAAARLKIPTSSRGAIEIHNPEYAAWEALDQKVPDAPFKDPADYATLELKQQMLNAAKQGQDYLGLIRGSDVADRFSQREDQREGTEYTYDKVYRSALNKLARQYGIEVRDVPTTLKSSVDIATPTMRELGYETPSDVLESARSHSLDDPDSDGEFGTHEIEQVLEELHDYAPNQAFRAKQALDNFLREYDNTKIDGKPDFDHPDVRSWWEQLKEDFGAAHEVYADRMRQKPGNVEKQKMFPSMVLTPEVREKILKAGVPIWALGAGLTMKQMMELGANEESQGFSDGGKVRGLLHLGEKLTSKQQLDALKRRLRMGYESGGGEKYLRELVDYSASSGRNLEDIVNEVSSPVETSPVTPIKKADGGIARLRAIAENVGTEDTVDRRKRILAGLASQLYGVNPDTGEVEFLGGASLLPKIRTIDEYRKRQEQAAEGTLHEASPGLIDEIQSMFLGTKGAEGADERLLELKRRVRDEMGVKEPHGFGEEMDEALGTMLGQVPVPTASKFKAVAKLPMMQRLRQLLTDPAVIKRMAKDTAKSLPEWFTPYVHPTPGNYLSGAVVGGGIGAGLDALEDSENEEKSAEHFADTWAEKHPDVGLQMAEGGKVESEGSAGTKPLHDMMGMLKARLAELSNGLPSMSDPGDNAGPGLQELQMKAKGGKVSSVARLLKRMKDLGIDDDLDSFKLDDGTYDVEDMEEHIEAHLEGVEETKETLKKAGLDKVKNPAELARKVRQKIKGHTEQ